MRIYIPLMLLGMLLSAHPAISADEAQPKAALLWKGIYKSVVYFIPTETEFSYLVDTKAQICYVQIKALLKGSGLSISPVPCADLKGREEWRKIITWE